MTKLKKTMATAAMVTANQTVPGLMGGSWATMNRVAMMHLLRLGGWIHLDGVRPDHGDDLDGSAGRQGFVTGHSLIFYRAVLQLHGDFAGAAVIAGDGQV